MNDSSKKFTFSIDLLNDVLTQTKSIKKKLAPFLVRFQQYQMSDIYKTFDYLHQCMTKPKTQLKYKFNSLFVLKVFLDTSNFVLVNWIEVLFLPHLIEIAKFTLGGQNNGKDYFLKQGYTAADDPDVEKFGYNYTLLAIQMIQVAALMKPLRLFQCDLMQSKSDFVVALEDLKKAGFKQPDKLSMYAKPELVEGMVAKYEQASIQIAQSEQFAQIYAQFCNKKLDQYLKKRHDSQQQKHKISIIQIYESGDLYASSQAIEICKAEINEPRQAVTFENALHVLHRLFMSADYETFYVLNYEDGLYKTLVDIVDCDKVERGLKRGEKFHSQFGKDSARIYGIFLDYLQKWAVFAGGFVKDDENFFKKIVISLGETLNIQFPQPQNLQSEKKRFQFMLSKNKQRSARLSEEIEKSPSQLKQVLNYINQAKKAAESTVKQSKKKEPVVVAASKIESNSNMNTPGDPSEPSGKEHPFVTQLNLVQETCGKFLEDDRNYDKNKQILEKFLNDFENQISSVPEEVFNAVYERALNLQADAEEILKKGQIKKSAKKQPVQSEIKKSSVKAEGEIKKSVSAEVQLTKPITNQPQQKIISKQVESETVIDGKTQTSKKNIARTETMKDSKKAVIEDTPVKRFDIQEATEKNEAEKLGYSSKVETRKDLEEKAQSNKVETRVQLGYDKPSGSNKNILPAKIGYDQEKIQQPPTNKAIPTQKQLKIGYEEDKNIQNVQTIQKTATIQSIKNIASVKNTNNIGYEQIAKKSTKELQQNSIPSSHGYDKNLNSAAQVKRQQSLGYEEPHKEQTSHKSIRKTEGLSQSRKNLEESSIKSNSKVEHFSPESSQFSQPEPRDFEGSNFKKKTYEVEDLQIVEQFYEEPVYINKPKEFKSLTGQNREKNKLSSQMLSPDKDFKSNEKSQIQEREPSEPNANLAKNIVIEGSPKNGDYPLGLSSQHSHLPVTISPKNIPNSYNQIQPEQDDIEEIVLDDDFIDPPSISPLEQSFHDIGELETKIKSILTDPSSVQNLNELSFKNCFETDKYILQRQEDKKTKMYWLQSDTTNLVKNILVKKEKSKLSRINVPQILDERNKKYQQQLKSVEEEKNKKIKELEGKIKNLQKQSQFFKEQAAQHAQQIRTLKANSDFDKQSVGQKGYLKDVQNIAVNNKLSSPQRFGYSGIRNFHFDTSNLKETHFFDPKGKLINSKKFRGYFKQFTKEKDKKLMLRSKDLLYKDKDIEIGFMSKKQHQRLIITLYVTPQRDIQALSWTVQADEALTVESEPNSFITYVRTRKQEKIFFTILVNRPSFVLPTIEFTYTAADQTHRINVTLPCAFHKFFFIKDSDNDLNDYFKNNQSIVRGEEVPYSKKVLKSLESLKDFFQSMNILNKGQPNQQGEISYGGMAAYRNYQFPVRISVKPNQFLYVQAVVSANDQSRNQIPIVEYYISTVTHLLMKEIE